MTAILEQSTSSFAGRAIRSLPFAVIVTDLEGRLVAVSDAARSALGAGVFEGMFYERLPMPPSLKRPEMAEPELLEGVAVADVWPVGAEDGGIIGAIQVLADAEAPLEGVKLCAAMAHELKNPLTGIQGFAALLQRDLKDNDARAGLARKIISGVHTLNATVSNMLDFCRPKPLHTEQTDLRALISSALELAGCSEGLDIEVDAGEWETICCDRLQMLQVIINLVKNAAEAMPGGGALTISAERKSDAIHLTVTDTGCGMDAHTQANIFRPFFSTKSRGTGMGLAVVRKIMQQHNGDIEIRSDAGRGTEVTLILPHA